MEKLEGETKSLLGGTFHGTKQHIRIIHWEDIVRIYKLLRMATGVDKKLWL